MKNEEIRKTVRESYGKIAIAQSSCCPPGRSCSCHPGPDTMSQAIGYTDVELATVPEGANLGLGCGNPTALASLEEGEIVLDLGSGAGIDCFISARAVGESGRVIGVDMTAEMLERSRQNAQKGGYKNVEFRLGEIENLPVADDFVDVVISNCVINLSPDKDRVFEEAYRVLKPGGRIMISDIALLKPLPEVIKDSIGAYVGCVAGAIGKQDYLETVKRAGFRDVAVIGEISARGIFDGSTARVFAEKLGKSPGLIEETAASIISMKIRAVKSG